MIELITGLPGNGKTLYTISDVKARALRENRQVFYHGIPDLTLPWERLEDPKRWATVPPGSIVVIDEAQKTFRNRSLGTVPPDFVTDLETHRHLGIDLVLITQHPSLIDPAVRRLSQTHRHLVRIWGMEASTVHRWNGVKDNCDKARSDSEKSKWAFDKSIYSLYKSAEQHTMKRSIPMRAKLLFVLPILLGCCAWFVYSKLSKHPDVAVVSTSAPQAYPGQKVPLVSGDVRAAKAFDPIADARAYVDQSTPRIAGLSHTAPKYDELTKPVRVPIPAACIQRGDIRRGEASCKCLTQQGTPMDVPFNMCVEFARNGWFQDFDTDREHKDGGRSDKGSLVSSEAAGARVSPVDTGSRVVSLASNVVAPSAVKPVVVK